jgi:hypothetical protein
MGRQYDGCGNDWLSKYEYAAANFAEICAWGGWLRAAANFSLDDEDVEIITPDNGALHNLPIGVGTVLLTLGPETKVQNSKRVDVPLSDTFASGTSPQYWYLKLIECKDNLGWIGGPLFRHSNGQRRTSLYFKSTHVYPLLHIQRNRGEPSLAPMMQPLATSLRPSFILLGCIEDEAGDKSPSEGQVVFGQHPKLKLQNMDNGELRAEAMMPCLNTTMRALWRTASKSHFFVCKVWIFRSFNGGGFFCFFLCLCFCEGFMELKGGGVLLLFQRGGINNDFARKGGEVLSLNPPPFFTLPVFTRFAK